MTPPTEHVPCVVCGADDPSTVYEPRNDERPAGDLVEKFRASGDELLVDRLVRCRRCSLQYVTPRVRGEVILSSYAEGEDPLYISQLPARERTFERSLQRIEHATGGKGRLLDIGTAAGAFVAVAQRHGWNAEGCEPNRWLARWGSKHYGIRIRPGSVFELDYRPGSFDVITLWDVIEHTPDPRKLVEHCRTLLKPGGVLVVNYPDVGSWVARALGRRWPFLSAVHLYYFDRRTIRKLLDSAGFDVELVQPHVQRLELGYILRRAAVVSRRFAKIAQVIALSAMLARTQVPYWLGQTFLVARRIFALLLPALSPEFEMLAYELAAL
jgi:SAM-dependent methyltransferase